jgi:hypothetical protein
VTRSLSFIAVLLVASTLCAADLQQGDVIVSGGEPLMIGFTFPRTNAYGSDAQFKFGVGRGGGDILEAPDGTIYAIAYPGSGIDVLSPSLQLQRNFVVAGGTEAVALAMNASGEILVGFTDGQLRWVTRDGVPIRSDALPLASGDHLATADLGLDQCTLYYVAFPKQPVVGHIGRYDLCTHTPMPEFPQSVGYAFGAAEVRVARDGAVWFAGSQTVYRFAIDGSVEALPTPPGDLALALAPPLDDRTLWLFGGRLRRVDIRSGTVLADSPATQLTTPSLVIHTVARASAQAATAPALSTFGIAMLLAMIALFALRRLT